MATLFDYKKDAVDAAAKHNAGIKERYEELKRMQESQLNESFNEAERERAYNTYMTPRASANVLAPERPQEKVERPAPVTAPTPTHTRVDSPLFTTEKLDKTLAGVKEVYETPAPIIQAQPQAKAATNLYEEQTPNFRQEEYSLSGLAKGIVAAFAALVVVMLSVICFNTHNLQAKNVKLRRLQEERAELEMKDEELDRRIQDATSFETVSEWAAQNGFIVD